MATSVRRALPWFVIALTAGCTATPVWTDANRQTSALPTRIEAETLLADAHRLAQAHDHVGLCQTVAQNPEMCRIGLQMADEARVAPSVDSPTVLGARTVPDRKTLCCPVSGTQGAEVLHIQGTHADGTVYQSDFSAVRAPDGQVRSQNAVYWFSNFVAPDR